MELYKSDMSNQELNKLSNWEKIKNENDDFFSNLSKSDTNSFSSINDSFSSLTGNNVVEIKHKNMEPFFNKKTQNVNLDKYIVDNDPSVNELYNNKKEVTRSNFFSPDKNIDNINGSSFQYEVLKNRKNQSVLNLNNNVFPIDQVRVGPGLDDGFNDKGTGGFHDYNTSIYAMPRNRDELRFDTNQKERTFAVDYQAPKIDIGQRGIVNPPSKNKPERVYEQTADNFFKTTGAILKNTNRPVENIKATNKQDSHIDYTGNIKLTNGGVSEEDNYNKESFTIYDNERKTTENKTVMNNATSIIKAIIAPILDGVKLSKKQYTIDAARETGGNISSDVNKATVYDPINHIAKTTVKETTIHDAQNTNLKGNDATYSSLNDDAKTTVKETTVHDSQNTNLKGNDGTYSALNDDAKTTVKETIIHDSQILNLKGTVEETYNNYDDVMKTTVKETTPNIDNVRNIGTTVYRTYVYNPDEVAKTTVKETTIKSKTEYGFIGGLLNRLVGGYSNKDIKLNNTNKEFTVQAQSRGNVSSVHDHRQVKREAYYATPQDETREKILIAAGHTPNPGNMNIPIDAKNVNMTVDKNPLHNNNYGNISKIYEEREPNNLFRASVTKENIQDNAYENRLDSSIMDALKSNELSIQINPINI
tara:strand:+ start:975 stop:2915 length:1941 start_codon:yes stop_codon:yes gene_type:complete